MNKKLIEMFAGARPYDFVDDKNNNIKGVSLHLLEGSAEGVTGYTTERVSVSNEEFKTLFGTLADFEKLIFKEVVISYNKRGKPVSYELVPQQK